MKYTKVLRLNEEEREIFDKAFNLLNDITNNIDDKDINDFELFKIIFYGNVSVIKCKYVTPEIIEL